MKTKFYFFVFFFLGISIQLFSQTGNWIWASGASCSSTSSLDECNVVSADPFGNIYVGGFYASRYLDFDGTFIYNEDTTGYSFDGSIAKYDANGNILWAKNVGDGDMNFCYGLTTDAIGNVYFSGNWETNSITFDTTTLYTTTGDQNNFIVKYNTNGVLQWAKPIYSDQGCNSYSLNMDPSGNLYIIGTFVGTNLIFGTDTITNTGGVNTNDIFVAKYNSAGTVLWAKDFGGSGLDVAYSACSDAIGNLFITGTFSSSSLNFGSTTLTNAGVSNVFIAKLNSNGNPIWAKNLSGSDHDEGNSVSTDPAGNVFMTGFFRSPVLNFGSGSLTNSSTSGSSDVFIAKYDPNGNLLWKKSAGGAQDEFGYTVTTDDAGNTFLGGGFLSPSITFDTQTLTPPAGICVGACDPIFLVFYDPNGNVLCTSALLSGGDDKLGLDVDLNDNVFVAGDFTADPFVVGSDSLPLSSYEDLFVAKYNCGVTTSTNEISESNSVSVFPNPSTGIFTLNSNIKKGTISVFNSIGENIYTSEVDGSNSTIDLSGSADGIYFITILTDNDSYTQKIIIQR